MLAQLAQPVAAVIAKTLPDQSDLATSLLAPPTKVGMGDLSLPCFQLAKGARTNPAALAQQLAEAINQAGVAEASAAGPFMNVVLNPSQVAQQVSDILDQHPLSPLRTPPSLEQATAGFGSTAESTADKGEHTPTICIDFSSPNIAKHLAFHHIRSTMIGHALANCYQACGWNVHRINFLGDWGTAFGRLIAGWHREGLSLDDLQAADDKVTFLNQLYVRISLAAKEDEQVAEEARHWSKKLEDGDAAARELWQVFKDASLAEFHHIYDLLGVSFDSWKGEAYYEDKMDAVLNELKQADILQQDDGALVVDLSDHGFKKPCLIQRADGGTLYATRDLAACQDRFNEFAFDRSLYVVDLGQSLHFKEWFTVAKKLNKSYAEDLRHIGFGVVLMWSEEDQQFAKGSSKSGRVMLLNEVLQEAIHRADAIIAEKNPELDDTERAQVARSVGVGAVVFNDLKNNRKGDVKFRFEDALNMQGDTGPYVQFTHARLCSIERKFAAADIHLSSDAPDARLLDSAAEKNIYLKIARLPKALEQVIQDDDPSQLASALLDLASATSSWLSSKRSGGTRTGGE